MTESEVQSDLLGLYLEWWFIVSFYLFGSWDGLELDSTPAALTGASAQKMGCLWSEGHTSLDFTFPDACFKGLWKLGNLIIRLG